MTRHVLGYPAIHILYYPYIYIYVQGAIKIYIYVVAFNLVKYSDLPSNNV